MTPVQDAAYQHMLARLREAREACGLTQVQVAERLGKPQSYVSKVERGERRIDPVELLDLVRLYGASYMDVLGGDDTDDGTDDELRRTRQRT